MLKMKNKIQPYFFLGIGIFQAIHSIEEYLTKLFDKLPEVTSQVHDAFGVFPVLSMSGDTFAALNMGIVAFILSVSPFVFLARRWALTLAVVIAIAEFFNGLGHVVAAIYSWQYFPGCISGAGLVLLSTLYLRSVYHAHTHK